MSLRSVIYPFIHGGANSLELRYSLRSVDRFMDDVQDVYLVTEECPLWFFGSKIHYKQTKGFPSVCNVMGKLRAACLDPRVTDDFWLFNDDFFLLDKPKEGPFFMSNSPIRNDGGIHHVGHKLSLDELDRRGIKTKFDGELHYPILYNKAKALALLESIDIKLPYAFRTLYLNSLGVQLAPARDVKCFTWEYPKPGMWIHSINGSALDSPKFRPWAEALYPNPSKWEA